MYPQYTPKDVTRFWSKVQKSSELNACWLWQAAVFSNGYGHFVVQEKTCLAHRVAWELENGKIPEGMVIMHICDTPGCVRLSHLRLGTYTDNSNDMVQKGRNNPKYGVEHPGYGKLKTHCNKGHELIPDNVIFTNHGKSRRCLICYRASALAGTLRYINKDRDGYNQKRREKRAPFKTGKPLGEKHGLTTLTDAEVLEIRRRHEETGALYYVLAEEYGVSASTISNIVRRITWKHI